jgi:hypothetical protein
LLHELERGFTTTNVKFDNKIPRAAHIMLNLIPGTDTDKPNHNGEN